MAWQTLQGTPSCDRTWHLRAARDLVRRSCHPRSAGSGPSPQETSSTPIAPLKRHSVRLMQFSTTRSEWARQLAEASGSSHSNEAELRHTVYTVLSPYCLSVVGLERSQLRHEGTSKSGRFDTMLGSTLIEWKNPGELGTKTKRQQHAEQAVRYLRDEDIGAVVVIVTDGRVWGILRDPEAIESRKHGPENSEPDQIGELFQWRDNSTETAGRILDLLDTITFEPVTPPLPDEQIGPNLVSWETGTLDPGHLLA